MKVSKELKLGSFAIIVLLLSFFVINYLRGKDVLNKEIELVSSYGNVEGLVPSDPVYIKGYKAGAVYSVKYNPETDLFDVTCSVLKKFRIPVDSRMTIYSRDIMGGKAILIDLGSSQDCVSDGSYLEPASKPDMMASISDSVVPITERLTSALSNIDSVAVSLKGFFNEANSSKFSRTLANLEYTVSNARKVSEMLEGKSDELESFIDNLAVISDRLGSVAVKADSTMTDVMSIASAVDSDDIAGTVASFKTLLDSIQDPDGTIGKLIYDGKVYSSFDQLLKDVDEVVNKIKENPRKFIKISLF